MRVKLTQPQASIFNNPRHLNLFHSGKGSGKTHLMGVISYSLAQMFPAVKGFIGANTYDQLNTSTMTKILEVWEKYFNLKEYTPETKTGDYVIHKNPPSHFADVGYNFISYKNILTFKNGHTIFLGSLDNAKAHEGKEFAYAMLDETKDSDENDIKDTILSRIRQTGVFINKEKFTNIQSETSKAINPLWIFTSPARVQWLAEWFNLDSLRADIESIIYSLDDYFVYRSDRFNIVISSTHHNQGNIPEDYIQNLILSNTEEKVKMIVYGSPFARGGAEYISSFDETVFIKSCSFDSEKAIHLSFDFNIKPYNSCGLFQISKPETKLIVKGIEILYIVRMFGEIALKPPANSVGKVCQTIIDMFQGHKNGMYIYGDATGKNRNAGFEEYKHNYDQIQHKLNMFLGLNSMRVKRSNAANVKRRDFMNLLFEQKLPIVFEIDPGCKYTIDDIKYSKVDVDGSKDPCMTKDEQTGEQYEKLGHMLDLCEYFYTSAFERYFNQ